MGGGAGRSPAAGFCKGRSVGPATLGVLAGATKEEVKAAYKKMVLKLHLDKNKNNQEKATELFKRLNPAYKKWRSNGTPAGQGGNNQSAPQPHHTNFQFNPTYFRSNFCGQNEPQRETPQQAQHLSREEDRKDQGAKHTWSSWLWGARKSRRRSHSR